MKVGVNLLWLRPGAVGGSEQYLCRQLVALAAASPPDLAVVVYAIPAFARAHPEVTSAIRVARIGRGSRPLRVLTESTWLAACSRGLDLVHHGGGTVPAVVAAPAVLTIHDLQYLTYPTTFSAPKLAYLRATVPRSVRRARVVCVPSAFVRSTVVGDLGVPPTKVVVVPHGIPAAERAGLVATPADDLRTRFALPGPVVVYPAITYRHKNHSVLLEAVARLRRSQPRLRLVLLGGAGPAEGEVASAVERLRIADVVVRPGRVSDADREGLYALATALAFPSRYEGFGAPVLEAMWRGCPVVAADVTALPEVVGDAGLLLPPDEPEQWAEAIGRLIDNPAEREALRLAGIARAGRFTGEVSAAALLGAYRAALAP